MKFLDFLLWVWQLPQNLIGFILTRDYRYKNDFYTYKGNRVNVWFRKLFGSGVSLGDYIILDAKTYLERNCNVTTVVSHEYGHQIQSKILGWLYLPLVGLPSICRKIWDRLFHKKWSLYKRSYWCFHGYPENWADKLGGVIRD